MGERSNDAQEKYSHQGQSLPVLLKFGDLSNKLQVFFFPLPRINVFTFWNSRRLFPHFNL